jgi:hypothetical protein
MHNLFTEQCHHDMQPPLGWGLYSINHINLGKADHNLLDLIVKLTTLYRCDKHRDETDKHTQVFRHSVQLLISDQLATNKGLLKRTSASGIGTRNRTPNRIDDVIIMVHKRPASTTFV